MAYFVTGATGFIGRRLVERLLEKRQGKIYVLVRESSQGPPGRPDRALERRRGQLGRRARRARRRRPAPAAARASRRSRSRSCAARSTHFFHLAAVYDMTAPAERNTAVNVGGTTHAVELARALDAKRLHHVSSIAVAGELPRRLRRGHVRRGPAPALALPPHQVRVRADRARAALRALARVPAGDRRRRLADRRDGQDRRPLLLLQGDPADAPPAARVGAARRPRPRLHEHRARSTGSPARSSTSPTSPTSTATPSTSPTRARSASTS